jgi:hypothetical protein
MLLLPLLPLPLHLSEVTMIINTQLLTNDMVSDMQEDAGETSLNANIYLDIRGATPSERAKMRVIIDQFYADIRKAIRTV